MALNHKTSISSRISAGSTRHSTPALASFVICPIGSNFVGSPVVSQLGIYQLAYEQAKIAANRQWWVHSQNWSQN